MDALRCGVVYGSSCRLGFRRSRAGRPRGPSCVAWLRPLRVPSDSFVCPRRFRQGPRTPELLMGTGVLCAIMRSAWPSNRGAPPTAVAVRSTDPRAVNGNRRCARRGPLGLSCVAWLTNRGSHFHCSCGTVHGPPCCVGAGARMRWARRFPVCLRAVPCVGCEARTSSPDSCLQGGGVHGRPPLVGCVAHLRLWAVGSRAS